MGAEVVAVILMAVDVVNDLGRAKADTEARQ